ncbi:MAG: hypothetical protein E6583_00785 [Clostridium sp.]|nr:hypothetical protein [Clostridium sp.]
MGISSLEDLKFLNQNKSEIGKIKNTYIVIKPIIPVKSGKDITEKIKEIYSELYIKYSQR